LNTSGIKPSPEASPVKRLDYLLIPDKSLKSLLDKPREPQTFMLQGARCELSIGVVDYRQALRDFYGPNLLADFKNAELQSGIGFSFRHFGLSIRFAEPVEICMHSTSHELLGNSRKLIGEFGFVSLKNAYLPATLRDLGHRNRFPHLNFHRDRNESQPTPYSLYTRNPFDAEQSQPRIGSTLVTANLVGYLQSLRQGDSEQARKQLSHYDLFGLEDMSEVLGHVVLEQRWDEPQGSGEIAMLDNRSVLHSSYMRQPPQQGYRIGVRYLS